MKAAQFQKLIEQLGELSPEQREALAKALAGGSEAAETVALIEARFAEKATCPHCQGELDEHVVRYFNWVEINEPPESDLKAVISHGAAPVAGPAMRSDPTPRSRSAGAWLT